ncbi:MAG: hypothetical protein PHN32_03445 [Actinomycetota bacterium]|jgi:hypothetical protein|nr:hypothetical protein [Actinomycetota bacterium]
MDKDKQSSCKCPYCDAELKLKESPICQVCHIKILHCPECGYPVSNNIDKCPNCGVRL